MNKPDDKRNDPEIDIAQLLLERIKVVPELGEYLRVTTGADDLEAIPLANLFFHVDVYYNRAVTIKTGLNFLTEEVGINQKHCVLVLAIEDRGLCQVVASIIAETTENYYVARAHTLVEANSLMPYFSLNEWACGIIIEDDFCGQPCDKILSSYDLPATVLTNAPSSHRYVELFALGATAIVPRAVSLALFKKRMETALVEMFMEIMKWKK